MTSAIVHCSSDVIYSAVEACQWGVQGGERRGLPPASNAGVLQE